MRTQVRLPPVSRRSPLLLLGTESKIAEQIREQRVRFGLSYVTVHAPYLADLAPVIAKLG
jgi:hypothetical protein